MKIERFKTNPHSFRINDGHANQRDISHPLEAEVLDQLEKLIEPGECGDFEIIVRKRLE